MSIWHSTEVEFNTTPPTLHTNCGQRSSELLSRPRPHQLRPEIFCIAFMITTIWLPRIMTHGYRVRVSTTAPSRILPGTLILEHVNCAHLSPLPVSCTCQPRYRHVCWAGHGRSCKPCAGLSQPRCLNHVCIDHGWTLSIHPARWPWHSAHAHHACGCWLDPGPGPPLSLHTLAQASPGQEQSVGEITLRWHAKLLVSYSCCLRGTEHDTGTQGSLSVVPATCQPSPTLWHVANKLAEPRRMELAIPLSP